VEWIPFSVRTFSKQFFWREASSRWSKQSSLSPIDTTRSDFCLEFWGPSKFPVKCERLRLSTWKSRHRLITFDSPSQKVICTETILLISCRLRNLSGVNRGISSRACLLRRIHWNWRNYPFRDIRDYGWKSFENDIDGRTFVHNISAGRS
jgi:hypothetical protein